MPTTELNEKELKGNSKIDEQIAFLISNPDLLIKKKPFTRGAERSKSAYGDGQKLSVGGTVDAELPKYKRYVVSQEQFMRELDADCHDVLFDENLPSLCLKIADGSYVDIKFERTPIPFQKKIKNKQLMHLSAKKMDFTMVDDNPDEKQRSNFTIFKQYWDLRNQDGMKTKMVDAQLSYGDSGLLYYFDYEGKIKCRLISYEDGYAICPHNNEQGDRIIESIYYQKGDTEIIDSYDYKYHYRHVKDYNAETEINWKLTLKEEHGFDEIPLVTKRGDVAWNDAQRLITSYEVLYNIFQAIERRHGWGILYIKGKFSDEARKINGAVVLNDTSIDGKGDAKYLEAPTPEGMLNTLKSIYKNIQIASSTTFILPEDINMSGDVSGVAVQLTLSQDVELAQSKVIDWQNVADKMVRLFKQGLAMELVNNNINENAVTEFENLHINAKFKVWRPYSETEYNNMLIALKQAGLISEETGIETNTVSKPDEKARIKKETDEKAKAEQLKASLENQNTITDNNNQNNKEENE